MKCLAIKIFPCNFPQLPVQDIVETLRIVTPEISELTFLLILYFHDLSKGN